MWILRRKRSLLKKKFKYSASLSNNQINTTSKSAKTNLNHSMPRTSEHSINPKTYKKENHGHKHTPSGPNSDMLTLLKKEIPTLDNNLLLNQQLPATNTKYKKTPKYKIEIQLLLKEIEYITSIKIIRAKKLSIGL